MRKIILFGMFCLLLTGCTKKVKCESSNKSLNESSSVVGIFKDKVLSKVELTESIKLNSSEEFERVCNVTKSTSSSLNVSVECKKRTVTVKKTQKIDSKDNVTKEKFIEEYKKIGYTCK